MKRKIIILLLLLLLAGCSDTTVYIPEEGGQAEDGVMVYIPMDPDRTTEEETAPAEETLPSEPEETEPEQKNSATISKKPSSTSNKGTSTSNKNNTPNKGTITGSTKPEETQPEATEGSGGGGQITVTVPVETQEPEAEVPATEPPATEPPLYDISGYVVSSLEYDMLNRINEYRLENDLDELWLDEYLCAIASCRSYEASLTWSHTRPDGRSYATVLSDYGYGGGAAGELLGYATGDGAAIIDKWMSSESHRSLLMGGSSTIGIGIYYAGGVIYVACLLIG